MAEDRRSCADFKFLVELCRRFPAAMISIPSVVKHELDSTQRKQAEGHLSAGAGYAQFMKNQIALFEEMFVSRYPQDRDVQSIYALMCLKGAGVLLDYGDRSAALNCMRKARKFAPSSKWWTVYWTLAALSPTTRIGSFLTRRARKIEDSRSRRAVAGAQPST
jgi:hypothetical protein